MLYTGLIRLTPQCHAFSKLFCDVVNMLWSHVTVMFLQSQQTPLHVAAYDRNADIVKVLLEEGADVNARDKVS